ncbi:MAG: hypothetical protein AB9866_06930 [Syntrophobacteraceae bacterium]
MNQPGQPPAGSSPTGDGGVVSDANPPGVSLPLYSQIAQAAGSAATAASFQNSFVVDPGVPAQVRDLRNQLNPDDHCWSLPATALGLRTPPANGISYSSAQELINAAQNENSQVTVYPAGATPPSVLGPNQIIVVADKDPTTGQFTTGHCGVGDTTGGVNDFTKPAPSALNPIPPKISHSASPDAFVNRSVTRARGDKSEFTVTPNKGRTIIIITK